VVLIDKRAFDYHLQLGTEAPAFSLPGVDGKTHALSSFAKPALVVVFWCNHCPYVKKAEPTLLRITIANAQHADIVVISSNDATQYPEDSFAEMRAHAKKEGYPFPYLHDESQAVAKAYGAECTPHAFAFDRDRKLRYQGNVDGLADAIPAIAAGKEPGVPLTAAFGCSVKWRY